MTAEDGTGEYIKFLRERGSITHIVTAAPDTKMSTLTLTQSCLAKGVDCPVPLPDGSIGINVPDGVPDGLSALDVIVTSVLDDTADGTVIDEVDTHESIDATLDELEAALSGAPEHEGPPEPVIEEDLGEGEFSDPDLADTPDALEDATIVLPAMDTPEFGPEAPEPLPDASDPLPEPSMDMAPELPTEPDDTATESTVPDIDDAESAPALDTSGLDTPDLDTPDIAPELTEPEMPDAPEDIAPTETPDMDRAPSEATPDPVVKAVPDAASDDTLDAKITQILAAQETILSRLDQLENRLPDATPQSPTLSDTFKSALERFSDATGVKDETTDVRVLASLQEILALEMARTLHDQSHTAGTSTKELIMDLRHAVMEMTSKTQDAEPPSIYLDEANAA